MPNYIISCEYSLGSWARMIRAADNRTEAMSRLLQSVGGSLANLYWEANGRRAVAIVELPDSPSATALNTVLAQSGAFKAVEITEVLNQEQLSGVLDLAGNIADEYHVPGSALLQGNSSLSNFQW